MGIQITIERDALEAAGWEISHVTDPAIWDDDQQYVIHPEMTNMVISKGVNVFHSYCEDAFFADCNDWGGNKPLFKAAGLLDIPHILS